MKSLLEIKQIGREVLHAEIKGMQRVWEYFPDDYAPLIQSLLEIKGRVILCGIGKSAHIARKISATMNSTGTPAMFMHAAEAIHGDMGMVTPIDFVILFSHSGNTPEIVYLCKLLAKQHCPMACITGNKDAEITRYVRYVLDYQIEKEACPLNLAPTTSTTIQLAMGDAIALALLQSRQFSASDFAQFHPGGNLGKRLYLTCKDLASQNPCPQVAPTDELQQVIQEISAKRLGATAVTHHQKVMGIVTDGDIRRFFETNTNLNGFVASDIMTPNPRQVSLNTMAVEALALMKDHKITQLPVVDDHGVYVGMIHLHDLHREGLH